jgi:iron complex outermembrane recepter protein
MKAPLFVLAVLLLTGNLSAAPITGTVKDAHGRPVVGAAVAVGNVRTVTTAASGAFGADVPDGVYEVRFTHPGFNMETRELRAGDHIVMILSPAFAETIVVSGIRAEEATPVTKTDIGRQEIEKRYHQQDIPLLMRDTPAINAWAESGTGSSGYSYISLRGISPTRINFTLDGVPLADSEDFGTYFVDFPDLAHSLESIQIQRGVGTSTFGSPAFGGSVNFESVAPSQTSETDARLAAGSFGTRFATAAYQTGALPGGFALYTRLSYNESDGFRDSSGIRQRNLFVSAARTTERSQIRITGFSGHEDQQLSFYATDAETLKTNLRANPLRPEEEDSFGYDLANIQYLTTVNGADLTASAYYQRGYGWYRLFDWDAPNLRQYGLDGMLVGALVTLSQRVGNLTTNYGVHANRFEREHTRDLVGGTRDYFNYGVKDEANAFAKVNYDRGAIHLYGDAQVRFTAFEYHGDVDIEPIDWTFFNPKIGFRYDLSAASSLYASAGLTTREPTRNDLFLGEDNPSVPHDLHAVRPERVFDVEAGLNRRTPTLDLAANLYAMEFRNEIAATGELSEIGLALRRNVPRSYRRGIEIDAAWLASKEFRFRTVANFSRNRISRWLEFRSVEPLLTPNVIFSQAVDYTPSSRLSSSVIGRYVGESYLDNTNNDDFTAPSFTTVDGTVSYALTKAMRLTLQVNNLLDNDRIFPNGYVIDGFAYYYPQATRNFMLMVDFDL